MRPNMPLSPGALKIDELADTSVTGEVRLPGLRLWGMPWVDLADGRVVGIEVLARRQGQSGRIYTPDTFLPQLEAAGQICQLDLLIARRAAAALAAAPGSLDIAVNLSGKTVSTGLVREFARVATDRGLDPTRVVFEITETEPVSSAAGPFVRELSEIGYRFALDDWGVGWSNFDRLRELPFGHVKIDKQFVMASVTEPWSRQLLRAMLAAARELRLPVVAEGAATGELVTLLQGLGVPYAQGYAFGKPAPLEQWLTPGASPDATTAGREKCKVRRHHTRGRHRVSRSKTRRPS